MSNKPKDLAKKHVIGKALLAMPYVAHMNIIRTKRADVMEDYIHKLSAKPHHLDLIDLCITVLHHCWAKILDPTTEAL